MKVTIVVDDKTVLCDGVAVALPNADWSAFDMDPNDPNDNIAAVQFDTSIGQGHAEFYTQITKQANRPNMRPPDWHLTQADFNQYFAWILPLYTAELARVRSIEAEKAEADAKAMAESEAADMEARWAAVAAHNARVLNPDAQQPVVMPENLITRDDLEAALKLQADKHAQQMAEFASSLAAAASGEAQ